MKAVVLEEDKDMHDPLTNDEKMQLQEMMVDVLTHPAHPPTLLPVATPIRNRNRHSDGL